MKKFGPALKIISMGFICLALAFFVWDWTETKINFYLSRINSGLERMAQVKTKSHNVTRNHSGQLLWQDIDAGEVVYVGNSIQTEKNSSTEIILDDGEKILIGPESLVRFARAEDKISLQLVEGKVEVKSPDVAVQEIMHLDTKKSKRLFIKTPRGHLQLNNSDLKLQAEKNNAQNFKIEVIRGAPELITATEKEILKVTPEAEKINVLKIEESEPELLIPEEKTAILENNPVEAERQPAQVPLVAPKVKSIKVKEIE